MNATLDTPSTVDAFLADVSADPRKYLKASQITLLRKLVNLGVASRVPNGWVLDGTFYLLKAFKPFIGMDLAEETFRNGHRLRPTARARGVVAALAERKRSPKAG